MRYDSLRFIYRDEDTNDPEVRMAIPHLWVNRKEIWPNLCIAASALFESTIAGGEHFIFTCGCGCPGCAGIDDGVLVLYEEERIIWWVPDPIRLENTGKRNRDPRRRVFRRYIFRPEAYRNAIRAGLAQGLRLAKSSSPPLELGPYGFNIEDLEKLVETPFFSDSRTHVRKDVRRMAVPSGPRQRPAG